MRDHGVASDLNVYLGNHPDTPRHNGKDDTSYAGAIGQVGLIADRLFTDGVGDVLGGWRGWSVSIAMMIYSGKGRLTEGLLDGAGAGHAHGHLTRYGGIGADARRVIK